MLANAELSGAVAASYLLGYKDHQSSHDHKPLYINQFVAATTYKFKIEHLAPVVKQKLNLANRS